ncbi:hypothetical protein KP509_21G069600 [Ceratopteris richardii]|nr:hypothetical protein KP509_21G069600 [Ceratopteris richardii]
MNVNDTDDQIFLTQVLYGCCRYKKLLEVLTAKLFSCKSPCIQCADQTLYTVLGYLVLIRLEELTFDNFRKFVLCQHPKKLLPFMKFMFSGDDLSNACRPEWIKDYDTEYVDSLIRRLDQWRHEAEELIEMLEQKFLVTKQQEKHSTSLKPFNLSTTHEKSKKLDESNEISLPPFKAKPSPVWKSGPTPTQKALEAACKESREKLVKFYSSPKNQPFHLRILERPSKFAALKEQIEAERKMETNYIPPRANPCPEAPTNSVKLTASAMLREHALYERKMNEEQAKLKAFEVDLRDDSDYRSWKEEMRSRDQIMENVHRQFMKAAVDASDQAAVDAKNAKVEENREMVKKVKEESQKLEALKEEFIVNLELFNRLRRENVLEGQKSVKSALIKVAELKKKRAREIQAETMKLTSVLANERASELAKKKELIQKLHNLERESAQIMKKFDRGSTAGHGLLGEMSIAELKERLALVKQAINKEEEFRRIRINAYKEEKNSKIAEKSAFVQKMRQLAQMQRLARKNGQILSHLPGGVLAGYSSPGHQ